MIKTLSFHLTQKEGEFLVQLARKAVDEYVKTRKCINVQEDVSEMLFADFQRVGRSCPFYFCLFALGDVVDLRHEMNWFALVVSEQ